MQNAYTTKTGESASLSRRTFMSLTASGAAMTLPTVAIAGAEPEFPIEVFDRHSNAVADALNEYLEGRFYAVIYPSQDYDNPVHLKSLQFERPLALSLEDQLEACISKLKAILGQLHPDVDDVFYRYTPFNDDRSYSLTLIAHAPARVGWDGEGVYQVNQDQIGLAGAGLYHVERRWSDMDRRWYLRGHHLVDGLRDGPPYVIDPRLIVRKVTGGAA